MRSLFLFMFGAASVFAQPISFGVKGGIPLSDFVSAAQNGTFDYTSTTQRYIIGPTVEIRLPLGLSIEADALYRRFHYDGSGTLVDNFITTETTANNWEFPVLLKYRFHFPFVRPYVNAGPAWDTLTGVKETVNQAFGGSSSSGAPPELRRNTTAGFVLGGGIDVHAHFLHISPELRYTRWFDPQINDLTNGLVHSNQNQAEFLVGFTF